jgi:vacuolar-type H+-ATPase subunit H
MSDVLKMAFEKASELMSEAEQEAFARWLVDALDQDEKLWDKAFADSAKKLESIADEVLDDYLNGRTEPLDVEKL